MVKVWINDEIAVVSKMEKTLLFLRYSYLTKSCIQAEQNLFYFDTVCTVGCHFGLVRPFVGRKCSPSKCFQLKLKDIHEKSLSILPGIQLPLTANQTEFYQISPSFFLLYCRRSIMWFQLPVCEPPKKGFYFFQTIIINVFDWQKRIKDLNDTACLLKKSIVAS